MIEDRHIILAHGNGGRFMRELIADIFARHLANPDLDVDLDAAPVAIDGDGTPFVSTDGFIVQPLEFPGGDIGSLAVHGTVNDLAVCGARPHYLTLNAFIEEGMEVEQLDRIIASLASAAKNAGVRVVAGDTKVLPRGEGGGLFLATTGVGIRPPGHELGMNGILPGDAIAVSGPVGDHGVCVMLAREDFDISGDVRSDCASVLPFTESAMRLDGLRFMRDPTRGGLATVAGEVARHTGHDLRLLETMVPVRDPVRMVCEMLGYDPYYLACEGRVVAIIAPGQADQLVAGWQQIAGGEHAAVIGEVREGSGQVVLETTLAGERVLEELEDDPLPRIC